MQQRRRARGYCRSLIVEHCRRGKWSIRDMTDGLRDYGIPYTDKEVRAFYNYLDVNRLQAVSFDSFYIFIKGELSPSRKALVGATFARLLHPPLPARKK